MVCRGNNDRLGPSNAHAFPTSTSELHLPQAARYYGMIALYVDSRATNSSMPRLSDGAGFRVADTFYEAGEALSYLGCLNTVLPFHRENTP